MPVDGRQGEWGRKSRTHILNFKHEAEREEREERVVKRSESKLTSTAPMTYFSK